MGRGERRAGAGVPLIPGVPVSMCVTHEWKWKWQL